MTTPQGAAPPATGGGLNKKLGPLPVWMWALGGGGVLAAVLYLRSKNKSSSSSSSSSSNCPNGYVDPDTGECIVNGVDTTQLAIVPEPTPTGTQATTTPNAPSNNSTYTVKAGDTWASIAKALGTTPQDLFQYQFSATATTSAALRTKLAQNGPNSIIAGNVLSYPTNGTYPTYQGFQQVTGNNFWPGPESQNKTGSKGKTYPPSRKAS
jgi:LysM repeat protein